MFIEPMPGIPSMPFIPPIWPGEGLGIGMFMSIFCWGRACEFGDADGVCIPGMFICDCGEGEGVAVGICIPGMFISIFCGDADGDGLVCGTFIPGIFICWDKGFGVDDV